MSICQNNNAGTPLTSLATANKIPNPTRPNTT